VNKTGGFVAQYASLSYQVIDLAFKMRKQGLKVMYQPTSVVEYHHVKAHTVTNPTQTLEESQQRLIKEWKKNLKTEHMEKYHDTFWARDRSFHKKTILVIGLEGPAFDLNKLVSRCFMTRTARRPLSNG
jgi:GT2 family glycosyltransferase